MTMTLPYSEPLLPREPAERIVPEPPRRGEPGGPPCAICEGKTTKAVWSDENWTLHPPVGGSLPGAVWLASRVHVDSFADLPEPLQPTSVASSRASSAPSSRSATLPACTSTAGATAAPTSTSGSFRVRSGWSRLRA